MFIPKSSRDSKFTFNFTLVSAFILRRFMSLFERPPNASIKRISDL